MIVSESLENIKTNRQFKIRPKYLKNALDWLCLNSILYIDVIPRDCNEKEYLQQLQNIHINSNREPISQSSVNPIQSFRMSAVECQQCQA